ncbi:probable alpha-ketoglutarate-dependent hypophosphite dioxygenase isoform X1 [Thrips palmi]|uniref:phytanoyl-CoA dioxygenase n=1 Tax=Thrips palmi TaxID=161013 RepID=A0A6P9AD47_THRPL|nr:probable alpha-ketoglutarate-dependent hypophosphite dioxygenase isoform X1 [Thrips palmi]XP_034256158.1 probable alpha-ketoglutarate-dependent hypophosphite dioxygenase isoform X1 [Thrips palmi]
MPKFLTPQEVQFYKDNGFIKINVLEKAEIDALSEEYDLLFRLQANDDMDSTWIGEDMSKAANNKKVAVLSLHGLQMFSDKFLKFLMNDKLLDALEDIMETPNIALHHTKAHIKPTENGAPYLMHQDYPYFPHKKHSLMAVFLHMDDTTPENGGLCVYPGSHKLGPLPSQTNITNGLAFHWCDPARFPIEGATPITAKKGEIVIFPYTLVHGSYLNQSNRVRRMFLVQVMDADDVPLTENHDSPAQGLMLRGIKKRLDTVTSSHKKNAIK